MGAKDPRVDEYISRSADFAQPILKRLRKLVHAACPKVEETMKWQFPHFMHEGRILCSMAAFKAHCAFGFWDGKAVVSDLPNEKAMGQLGRITSLADLPSDEVLKGYVKKALALRVSGKSLPKKKAARPEVEVPDYFLEALKKNKLALATFEGFSPSHRREYVEWITEAKREETRQRRIKQAVQWLAEGKGRNWKYENC